MWGMLYYYQPYRTVLCWESMQYFAKYSSPYVKTKEPLSTMVQAQQFVPAHKAVTDLDVSKLSKFIRENGKFLVITGAGVSTESGIPDYRSEGVGLYASSKHRPVIYRDFLRDPVIRQRYWGRNFAGWPQFSAKQPNFTHKLLKTFEDSNIITGIVTQNVDSLHFKAGSKCVTELHGTAYRIICIQCEYSVDRHLFQKVLSRLNRPIALEEVHSVNPDGDITLPEGRTHDFVVPSCPSCGGVLKPDIVFFGDNVPKERVEKIRRLVNESESIVVLGSSLSVYSSYRLILQAVELNKPVLIVNIGSTRADNLATVKLSVRCSEIFERALKFIMP